MNMYNDGLVDTSKFEQMAKEYSLLQKSQILKTKNCDISSDDVSMLFAKIEYLKVLTNDLSVKTKNANILLILSEISAKIVQNYDNLTKILKNNVKTESIESEAKMFCNNLKLAINTTGDILKLLIKIKDDDNTFELSPPLTEAINSFIEINNQYVSLFGECQYLRYSS